MKSELLRVFHVFLPTPPREMAPRTCQQPTPCVPATNNAYGALAELSEDEISPSSDMRHGTNLGTYPSGDANVPTPFLFGPIASHDGEHRLEATLHQLMVNSFTCMTGHIKGLANVMQENTGSEAQYRRQIQTKLDAIMASTTEAQPADHKCLLSTKSKLEGLLHSTETIKRGNDKIMTAYHALHDENTMLKTAIEDLM
jgi:hypothetical protein